MPPAPSAAHRTSPQGDGPSRRCPRGHPGPGPRGEPPPAQPGPARASEPVGNWAKPDDRVVLYELVERARQARAPARHRAPGDQDELGPRRTTPCRAGLRGLVGLRRSAASTTSTRFPGTPPSSVPPRKGRRNMPAGWRPAGWREVRARQRLAESSEGHVTRTVIPAACQAARAASTQAAWASHGALGNVATPAPSHAKSTVRHPLLRAVPEAPRAQPSARAGLT